MQLFGRSLEVGNLQLLLQRTDAGGRQIAIWTEGAGAGTLRDAAGSVTDSYGGGFGTPASIVLGGRYNGAPFGYSAVDVYATVGVARVLSTADQQRLIDWAALTWGL